MSTSGSSGAASDAGSKSSRSGPSGHEDNEHQDQQPMTRAATSPHEPHDTDAVRVKIPYVCMICGAVLAIAATGFLGSVVTLLVLPSCLRGQDDGEAKSTGAAIPPCVPQPAKPQATLGTDVDCRNHIGVVQPIRDGSTLYICGTNARAPTDWQVQAADLTLVPAANQVPMVGTNVSEQAQGRCPYYIHQSSESLWLDDAPSSGSSSVVALTVLSTGQYGYYRYGVPTLRGLRLSSTDSTAVQKPKLVGAYSTAKHAYFVFREEGIERKACGARDVSTVARVCKVRDVVECTWPRYAWCLGLTRLKGIVGGASSLTCFGGSMVMMLAANEIGTSANNPDPWTSLMKTRLRCVDDAAANFSFDEIYAFHWVPDLENGVLFGAFVSVTAAHYDSAVCAFLERDVERVYVNGTFYELMKGDSFTLSRPLHHTLVPPMRPGIICPPGPRTLSPADTLFWTTHPLVIETPRQRHNRTFYAHAGAAFRSLVAFVLNETWGAWVVCYVSTEEGALLKIAEKIPAVGQVPAPARLVDTFKTTTEPVRKMLVSLKAYENQAYEPQQQMHVAEQQAHWGVTNPELSAKHGSSNWTHSQPSKSSSMWTTDGCRNYIREVQPIRDGSTLYVCGTNSRSPTDWQVSATDLTLVPEQERVVLDGNNETGKAEGRCSYLADHMNPSLWLDDAPSPGNSTVVAMWRFKDGRSAIYRSAVPNVDPNTPGYPFLLTDPADAAKFSGVDATHGALLIVIAAAEGVSALSLGSHVYFVYREEAVERLACGRRVASAIARVCKNDLGGDPGVRSRASRWTSFMKVRLVCTDRLEKRQSVKGSFTYDEIVATYLLPDLEGGLLFGSFVTYIHGFPFSAVCAFRLEDIERAFNGTSFFQLSLSRDSLSKVVTPDSATYPGTGSACVPDSRTLPPTGPDFLASHPLLAVPPDQRHGRHFFSFRGVSFSSVAVLVLEEPPDYWIVCYVATRLWTGLVMKVAEKIESSGNPWGPAQVVDEFNTTTELIEKMLVSKKHRSLYVFTYSGVRQYRVDACEERHLDCEACVRDPPGATTSRRC
ncbi:hypothetical protein HPB50_015593 [Hyalomma asiaticum]|uniref:Uncharacterized protein n=1 Tax=Hyalomma asiaticum TaxID=266040 RepID=A0ACB7SWJ9_HYAAI|nr:hypothetical protein HPB50_015593 [Hyalomma asiaticum]